MAGKGPPRKSVGPQIKGNSSGKLPASNRNRSPIQKKNSQPPPRLTGRPRRFSLIYSSDSSLSDIPDIMPTKKSNKNNSNKKKKSHTPRNPTLKLNKKIGGNTLGKRSKIIDRPSSSDDENTESSDYQRHRDTSSDSDDDDDPDSTTSSDDDTIDFVKLSVEKKKRAMHALSARKRGTNAAPFANTVTKTPIPSETKDTHSTPNEDGSEDLGEEVKDTGADKDLILHTSGDPSVYQQMESSDSDYNIDQDAFFNAIEDDDNPSMGDLDAGLDTGGEDDIPMLKYEEKNIVSELQNDNVLNVSKQNTEMADMDDADDVDNEDEDEIITEFDMPFYEDPKFASLYYYEDGQEPRLTLSTSLPLLLNDEKLTKIQKREAKRKERKDRIRRRRSPKSIKYVTGNNVKSRNSDGDDYIFSIFFQSDEAHEEEDAAGTTSYMHTVDGYDSSNEDDDILHDVASLVSGDDEDISTDKRSLDSQNDSDTVSSSDLLDFELEGDDDDDDDDNVSLTNIFIDIDDLDPDSFYFNDNEEDSSSTFSGMLSGSEDTESNTQNQEPVAETIVYPNDESTDEDDNLPPPSSRVKKIGSKAKEVVSANVVGLRPPKLGTWETDSKPFTIIDGLSTKSLHHLIQEHQQLLEHQRLQSQSPLLTTNDIATTDENREQSGRKSPSSYGDDMSFNELLNMSELEDDDKGKESHGWTAIDWYDTTPKVPLSAFRNKGINTYDEEEYVLPLYSTRKYPIGYVGSERTRRKIDRMKELQRKESEKKRKLKKKKKILKLRRAKARLEKQDSLVGDKAPENIPEAHPVLGAEKVSTSDISPVKSVGLEEINQILGKDNADILPNETDHIDMYDQHTDQPHLDMENSTAITSADAELISSLTAPADLDAFEDPRDHHIDGYPDTSTIWRRRHSIVEAAEENLRFTKNGLFSESALADIEDIIDNGTSQGVFEFNEVLQ